MRPGTKIQSRGGIGEDTMNAQQLLQEISDYCRQTGLAESTFGRRAVNDGKLANRLRNGGRITTDTLDRIRAFMTDNRSEAAARPALIPRAPAVRVFDAGVGDGSVLTRVMRAMHDRFPTMPFYVVGKEISLEDIRLTLQKMADRFVEHPATALALTNLAYADAPSLHVKSLSAASSLVWHEVALT